MKVGKASFGNKKKDFKIKDGSNVFRILPALGNLADSGQWYVYNRVEWGYKDSDGINRPFLDCRELDFDNKDEDDKFLVKTESAAHVRREALKSRKEELVELLKKDRTNATLLEEVKTLNLDLKRYNLDAKYYLNAVNLQGEIGLLKINASHYKALKAKRDSINETKGEDILAINGGYFMNFSRVNETGKITDYVFEVSPYQEDVNVDGEVLQKTKKHNMDDSFINRLGNEARELSGMFVEVTSEQVSSFVSDGIPAIEAVLGRAKAGRSNGTNTSAGNNVNNSGTSGNSTNTVAETKVEQRAEAVVDVPITNVSEKKVVTQTPADSVKTVETPAATAEPVLSEDEFLKSIGAI